MTASKVPPSASRFGARLGSWERRSQDTGLRKLRLRASLWVDFGDLRALDVNAGHQPGLTPACHHQWLLQG